MNGVMWTRVANMMEAEIARGSRGGIVAVAAAVTVFGLALAVSWTAQNRLDAFMDRVDARALDSASEVLEELVAQQGEQLAPTVAVLSEDARVRAMVLTPTFDRATVLDLLSDLKVTSNAGVMALLDDEGRVRAVVGAPELDRLDLGASSLVKQSLDKPSSQVWAFDSDVGVLAVSPVRVEDRVLAFFMMGIEIEDSVLQRIERTLGASGAVFVGDRMVASASRDADIEQALRAAAAQPPGSKHVVAGKFLALSAPLHDSAVAKVAWIVPLYRHADGALLTRALAWVPALLVGLVLAGKSGRARSGQATH